MRPDVLVVSPMIRSVMTALETAYTVHKLYEANDRDDFLATVGARVRGVATNGHAGLSRAAMEKMPALEIIASYGVGYDAVDVVAAKARGIRVTNTPDVLNDAVAEITIGMMVALCRRIVPADRHVRTGGWLKGNYPLTAELTGATVGIVGLGRIGKEIARRCQAMKMRVVYHGRRHQPFEPYQFYPNLVDMAKDCDWLVVIAPGSTETRHMVNRTVLEALGPDGSLVNVGRGSIVDEEALVDCLTTGRLGAAALDVFEDEPRVPEVLFGMDNVLLSPHQGSATHKTREAMGDLVVANLAAHFAGDPLLTPVV